MDLRVIWQEVISHSLCNSGSGEKYVKPLALGIRLRALGQQTSCTGTKKTSRIGLDPLNFNMCVRVSMRHETLVITWANVDPGLCCYNVYRVARPQ